MQLCRLCETAGQEYTPRTRVGWEQEEREQENYWKAARAAEEREEMEYGGGMLTPGGHEGPPGPRGLTIP